MIDRDECGQRCAERVPPGCIRLDGLHDSAVAVDLEHFEHRLTVSHEQYAIAYLHDTGPLSINKPIGP